MSILSDFEDRVADAVEGLFAGAFRSPVQPVELAKALAKAMDDGRKVGVGKVYAPVSYTVSLSREDRRNLGEFTATLEGELETYLDAAAREHGYTLAAHPTVQFAVDNDLKLGRFRVKAGLAPARDAEGVEGASAAGAAESAQVERKATVTVGDTNHDVVLDGERVTIGRLADCGIVLADANVSRTHAAFVATPSGWSIADLGSTNGTRLNGETIPEPTALKDGDVIEVGATRLVYHGPRS